MQLHLPLTSFTRAQPSSSLFSAALIIVVIEFHFYFYPIDMGCAQLSMNCSVIPDMVQADLDIAGIGVCDFLIAPKVHGRLR